ncbi:MAG: winged helix DNA-binding domain-containing protein [Nocardioides sp.]
MTPPTRYLGDAERRARVARRHGIDPAARLSDPVAATRAMTVLHATEPATVYLSMQARVNGLRVEDADSALYDDRSLVKQLAMRRTLFVFPRDLLPAAWGSASERIAGSLATRLAKDIELAGLADDGVAWLAAARVAVLARLADGAELSAVELREQVPELTGRMDLAPGKTYNVNTSVSPRVLGQLGLERLLVRGRNGGHWRVSRPRWTLMSTWLGEVPGTMQASEGYAELTRRWLRTFGPGTAADVQWWLGATAGIVKSALADVGAVPVALDGDRTGFVLPDDLEPVEPVEPWAALLPVLDPTVMGWKERGFFLGEHARMLFDRNGNAGTTAWWDGRIVGCWVQDADGVVRTHLLERLSEPARSALDVEAARLTAWLEGVRVGTVYPSPAMKQALAT